MKGLFNKIGKIFLYITIIGSIIVDIQIIWHEWAYPGIVFSFLTFPLAFFGIPIFSIFKYARWLPIIITYGGGIISIIIFYIGGEFGEK